MSEEQQIRLGRQFHHLISASFDYMGLIESTTMRHLISSWEHLAEHDPLWAILTSDEKANRRWNPEEFFATGVADVEHVWQRLGQLDLRPAPGRALDFGCGVGRLTRALAPRFTAVDGVDVSATMLGKAAEFGSIPPNVRFLHNPHPHLNLLAGSRYSFVLSLISLQHVPSRIALRYLAEFCDLLEPGGIAYVQMFTFLDPTDAQAAAKLTRDESTMNRGYRKIAGAFSRKPPRMDTHYCRLSASLRVAEARRVRIVAVLPEASAPRPFVSHAILLERPRIN
jgi:SAM-dependent methyltransferase